ncbi:MAG: hypothetical protein P4L00_00525 [Candidatus Acidoferrales bacterium]|nr:hypothetical protein [Candidatus Acidoferrales bacterium]
MTRRTILIPFALLCCLLLITHWCGAQTEFEIRNKEGLGRNPAGLRLSLRTKDGRSAFHLFETIPIELEFRSSRSSAYSLELDEEMNFAGQANKFEVSPRDTVFLPYPAMGSHFAVCCSSSRHYLSSRPTTLRRELTDYLRFETAGTYSVFLVTNRVFEGLGKSNDFDPSKLNLTSNVLTLTILPDDPEWDSQKLAESLRKLDDPHVRANYAAALAHAHKLALETETDFAMANAVSQTEFVLAQKALSALDTKQAIGERVRRMQMESKSDLEFSRKYNTAPIFPQPVLRSTTRADLVAAAMTEQSERPDFGVDYNYFEWWVGFLVQRDHPELFRPLANEIEHDKILRDYTVFKDQAEQELIANLETLGATKTSDAADVTGLTVKIAKAFMNRSK